MIYFYDNFLHTSRFKTPKGGNKTDNKYDENFIIMKVTIESKRQKYDVKLTKLTEDLKLFVKSSTTQMMDQNNISKCSLAHNGSPKSLETTNVVPANRRYPKLDGGHSTKIDGMWNIKHEIRSPKFYKLLAYKELKINTILELKNLYNHINVCHNAVTRLQ